MKRTSLSDGGDGVAVFGSFAAGTAASRTSYTDVSHRTIFYLDLAIFRAHSLSTDIAVVADGDCSHDLGSMAMVVERVIDLDSLAAKRVDSLSLESQDGYRGFAAWFQSSSSALSPEVFATIDNWPCSCCSMPKLMHLKPVEHSFGGVAGVFRAMAVVELKFLSSPIDDVWMSLY